MRIAVDGEEALQAVTDPDFRPDLIVLDLNLPWISGGDVLREIKSNPATRNIPVFVLSGSSSPEQIRDCFELKAACFMLKPNNWDDWKHLAEFCWAGVGEAVSTRTSVLGSWADELRRFLGTRLN